MLNAIRTQEDSMLKVWMRRGSIRKGSRNIPVDAINHFHAIVRPGDSVGIDSEDELDHGVSLIRCNPSVDGSRGNGQSGNSEEENGNSKALWCVMSNSERVKLMI